MNQAELVAFCRERMRRGSLSFFLAARLLGRRVQDAVQLLYAWCRHCDDVVDGHDGSPQLSLVALDELRRETWAAMHGSKALAPQAPVFAAFALLAERHRIPDDYPQELLSGMEMDLTGRTYATLDELRLYGYRVAGTVGLMFCHIAGVSDPAALRHAADLGTAMQLTNIARDVLDDHRLGRCYLPATWLAEAGLTPADVGRPEARAQVAQVVARLLDAAEVLYGSGDAGLRYLPLTAAFAVAAARQIYAGIGVVVRRRGPLAWDERAQVPLPRKLRLAARGAAQVLATVPGRLRHPWRPVELNVLWRFQ